MHVAFVEDVHPAVHGEPHPPSFPSTFPPLLGFDLSFPMVVSRGPLHVEDFYDAIHSTISTRYKLPAQLRARQPLLEA